MPLIRHTQAESCLLRTRVLLFLRRADGGTPPRTLGECTRNGLSRVLSPLAPRNRVSMLERTLAGSNMDGFNRVAFRRKERSLDANEEGECLRISLNRQNLANYLLRNLSENMFY